MREVIPVPDRILKIKFSFVLVWSLFILTLPSKHVKLGHCLAAALVDLGAGWVYVPVNNFQPWRSTKHTALTNCIATTTFVFANILDPGSGPSTLI